MINITFPDGAVRQYENGVTALDIAKSISEGLARKVLAANVNGEVWDATRPIYEDANLKLLTWNDAEGKSTFWHSSAHFMAEAVESMFPGVKFWVGPPVENGFYYDMDLGDRKMSEEDLRELEKKMNELAKQNNAYIRKEIPKAEAINYFTEKGDEYKLDLCRDLKMERSPFIRRVILLISAVARIFPAPDLSKRSSLPILPALTGKAMKKIKCSRVSMAFLSQSKKNWMNICNAGRSKEKRSPQTGERAWYFYYG